MESALFSDVVYLFMGVPITFLSWMIFSWWFLYRQKKRFQSLNHNLSTIGKRWSLESDSIVALDSKEKVPGVQQYLIIGFIACLFSWLGFVSSIPMWLSMALVQSRKEKFILASEIARSTPVETLKINEVIEQFSQVR